MQTTFKKFEEIWNFPIFGEFSIFFEFLHFLLFLFFFKNIFLHFACRVPNFPNFGEFSHPCKQNDKNM